LKSISPGIGAEKTTGVMAEVLPRGNTFTMKGVKSMNLPERSVEGFIHMQTGQTTKLRPGMLLEWLNCSRVVYPMTPPKKGISITSCVMQGQAFRKIHGILQHTVIGIVRTNP
jgi:hypothetical protein